MPVCRFIPLALLGLQVLATVPTHSPTPVCYEKKYKVHKADCITALSNIVYDNDGKLSHLGTQVAVAFESCVIAVYYSKDATYEEKDRWHAGNDFLRVVWSALHSSIHSAGMSIIPDSNDAEIYITPRQTPRNWNTPYDPDYPFDKLIASSRVAPSRPKRGLHRVNQSFDLELLISPIMSAKLASDMYCGYHPLELIAKSRRTIKAPHRSKNKGPVTFDFFQIQYLPRVILHTDESKSLPKAKKTGTLSLEWPTNVWGTVNIKGAEGPNGHTIITTRTY
ncbi:hypothetical protein H4Q26_012419 [Puccinia striiformis f. sp. tritici PST-130]|nr:hypothetical protein H4Q26_012419 [Puccinia striiformis f. sp. tritici PST-130]